MYETPSVTFLIDLDPNFASVLKVAIAFSRVYLFFSRNVLNPATKKMHYVQLLNMFLGSL